MSNDDTGKNFANQSFFLHRCCYFALIVHNTEIISSKRGLPPEGVPKLKQISCVLRRKQSERRQSRAHTMAPDHTKMFRDKLHRICPVKKQKSLFPLSVRQREKALKRISDLYTLNEVLDVFRTLPMFGSQDELAQVNEKISNIASDYPVVFEEEGTLFCCWRFLLKGKL